MEGFVCLRGCILSSRGSLDQVRSTARGEEREEGRVIEVRGVTVTMASTAQSELSDPPKDGISAIKVRA